MKKTLLLAVCLLSLCTFAVTQTTEKKTIAAPVASTSDTMTSINNTPSYDLAIGGNKIGIYALTVKDSTLVVNDSLLAIKGLLDGVRNLQQQGAQQNNTIKQYESALSSANLELETSREILRYINIDGTIKDRKKFDALVQKYQAITGNK